MFQIFPNSKFYEASKYIYDWTVNFNKNGSYFPLWGTCLGKSNGHNYQIINVIEMLLPDFIHHSPNLKS